MESNEQGSVKVPRPEVKVVEDEAKIKTPPQEQAAADDAAADGIWYEDDSLPEPDEKYVADPSLLEKKPELEWIEVDENGNPVIELDKDDCFEFDFEEDDVGDNNSDDEDDED